MEDDWDESDIPGWFEDLLLADPNNHVDGEDQHQQRFILRRWIEICSLPPLLRPVYVSNYHQAALAAQREVIRTAVEESHLATEKISQLETQINNRIISRKSPNHKKKETVDTKIATAVEEIKEALEGLTRLQKKRVLKKIKIEDSE